MFCQKVTKSLNSRSVFNILEVWGSKECPRGSCSCLNAWYDNRIQPCLRYLDVAGSNPATSIIKMEMCNNKKSDCYGTVCLNEFNLINGIPLMDCNLCLKEQRSREELDMENEIEVVE